MIYLLDANVLIDANRDYYPMDRVPEFWSWLEHNGKVGKAKIPYEIYYELKQGNDDLATWIKKSKIKEALLLNKETNSELVSRAIYKGYAPDLTDDELQKLGRDPFLLAYSLEDVDNHCIVTTEVLKPSKQRANRHLPDAASILGIRTINTFKLLRELDFRTDWQA